MRRRISIQLAWCFVALSGAAAFATGRADGGPPVEPLRVQWSAQGPAGYQRLSQDSREDNKVWQIIAAAVAAKRATDHFPGIAVLVYRRGRAYEYYNGVQDIDSQMPIDRHTIFELGGLTKSFTAHALALAMLSKGVSLNDFAAPLISIGRDFFPPGTTDAYGGTCPAIGRPTPVPSADYATFATTTLGELAMQTSTLPFKPPNPFGTGDLPAYQFPCYPPRLLANYVDTATPAPGETPGATWIYSNVGYGMLGYALQGIYRQSYRQIITQNILAPLDMRHTYVDDVPKSELKHYATGYLKNGKAAPFHWPLIAWPGASQLRSSGPDMLTFLEAAMQLAPGEPGAMKAAFAVAEQPLFKIDGGQRQGLAWIVQKDNYKGVHYTFVQKYGGGTPPGGFNTSIELMYPQPGVRDPVGVVILVNKVRPTTAWDLGPELLVQLATV